MSQIGSYVSNDMLDCKLIIRIGTVYIYLKETGCGHTDKIVRPAVSALRTDDADISSPNHFHAKGMFSLLAR